MVGVLLTGPQYMLLAHGAGLDHGESSTWEPGHKAAFSDVLSALLLSGKAIVTAPEHVTAAFDSSRLQSEGLIEFRQTNYSSEVRAKMASAYDAAFSIFRKMENHPRYANILSIERHINKKPAHDAVDIAEQEAELEYQLNRFGTTYQSIVDFLGAFFGENFHENHFMYIDALQNYLGGDRVFHNPAIRKSRQVKAITKDSRPLSSILGLEVRSAVHFESEFPLFSYLPHDLLNFDEQDSLFCQGLSTGNFLDYAQLGMDLSFRLDKEEFVRTHALFKTIFELYELMKFSEIEHCPIYIPGNIDNIATAAPPHGTNGNITQSQNRLYKIFLSERGYVPKLDSLDDVLRLRDDKRLRPLRQTLQLWEDEIRNQDTKALEVIRRDIGTAQKELKKLGALAKAGQYVSYASLPIGVADLFMGTPFSLLAGAIGSALDIKARAGIEKFSWFNFGT